MAKKEKEVSKLQELKADIKAKSMGRLYVFHGEEKFLLHYYFDQVRKILLDELTESFNFHKYNGENFSLQSFVDSVEGFPMMSEHTLVVVDDVDLFKLPEGEREKIGETLSDIPDWCTVIFTYETVTWKPDKRLKKIWEPINAHAVIVEFEKQNQRELINWVSRHFQSNGKRISKELLCKSKYKPTNQIIEYGP